MAYNDLFTKKMVEFLQFLITGCVHKISQPDNDTTLVIVRQNRQNHQSLLSIHPDFSRLQLTTKKYDNSFNSPMFARVFRKYLEGGVIESTKQVGNDHRIEISMKGKDEVGDTIYRTVILEIMGKHSNLISVDENRKVIEGSRYLTPNTNHYRTVMPGFNYGAPPTQHKMNPYDITGVEMLRYIDFNADNITKQLLNQSEGFSPLVTNEIINRRQFMTSSTLPEAFDEVIAETKLPPTPIFHKNHETGEKGFYFIKLSRFNDDIVTYGSSDNLLDRFYDIRDERERVKQRANDLVRFV